MHDDDVGWKCLARNREIDRLIREIQTVLLREMLAQQQRRWTEVQHREAAPLQCFVSKQGHGVRDCCQHAGIGRTRDDDIEARFARQATPDDI